RRGSCHLAGDSAGDKVPPRRKEKAEHGLDAGCRNLTTVQGGGGARLPGREGALPLTTRPQCRRIHLPPPASGCRTYFVISVRGQAASLARLRRWACPGRLSMYFSNRPSSLSTAARTCRMASPPSGRFQNRSVPLTR